MSLGLPHDPLLSAPVPSYPMLLPWRQIASGMRYLATLNFASGLGHEELPGWGKFHHQNSRLWQAGTSTLGTGRVQGRAVLPIRWMAWDASCGGEAPRGAGREGG